MSLTALGKVRRLSGAIALIGMAFYAMLFPWHTVSQTSMLLAQAGLGMSALAPCHREAAPPGDTSKPSQPAKQTHCPICNGFAALPIAMGGPVMALIAPPAAPGTLVHGIEDQFAGALVRAPQSRGPPLTPA